MHYSLLSNLIYNLPPLAPQQYLIISNPISGVKYNAIYSVCWNDLYSVQAFWVIFYCHTFVSIPIDISYCKYLSPLIIVAMRNILYIIVTKRTNVAINEICRKRCIYKWHNIRINQLYSLNFSNLYIVIHLFFVLSLLTHPIIVYIINYDLYLYFYYFVIIIVQF